MRARRLDVETRRQLRTIEKKGFDVEVDELFLGSIGKRSVLCEPYAFSVRLKDQVWREYSGTDYDEAASIVPQTCRGLPIMEVSIWDGGCEVYYERRSNVHQDRLA